MIIAPHPIPILILSIVAFVFALYAERKASFSKSDILISSLLAIFSLMTYYSVTGFFKTERSSVHYHEQFHYTLSAKYSRELAYDGLYVASVLAQREQRPDLPIQPAIRDLRSNIMTQTEKTNAHGLQVKSRFSEDRWREFSQDNLLFVDNERFPIQEMRKDHGFNGTPSWQLLSALFASGELDINRLKLLALIDPFLILLAFFAVYFCFGLQAFCWCCILYGTSYAGGYSWIGGSLLRLDWLAAIIGATCAMQKDRYILCGVLLGFATMERIFPLFFMVGPFFLAMTNWRAQESIFWFKALLSGYLLTIVATLFIVSVAAGGPLVWWDFYQNLQLHSNTLLGNNVGFRHLFFYAIAILEVIINLPWHAVSTLTELVDAASTGFASFVDHRQIEPWTPMKALMDGYRQDYQWLFFSFAAGITALFAYLVRFSNKREALLLGVVFSFFFLQLTNYYWLMLCLLALCFRRGIVPVLLFINIVMCIAHILIDGNLMVFGLLNVMLIPFTLWWGYLISKTV